MTISASQVKELRERTGVGMMECKKALTETNGDIQKAILWLRERGLSRAAAKAARTASQGVVDLKIADDFHSGAILEVNSETDFVSNNPEFREYVKTLTGVALKTKAVTINDLRAAKMPSGATAQDALTEMIARIGENMVIRRVDSVSGSSMTVGGYIHANGKIGVLVGLEGHSGNQVQTAAKDLAMHIAASSPRYVASADVPADEIAQERELARKKMVEEKKPAEIIEKILSGQMQKLYKEICLVEQPFVKQPEITVGQYLAQINPGLKVGRFIRFALGEGIERKEEDFAAEVAKQLENK